MLSAALAAAPSVCTRTWLKSWPKRGSKYERTSGDNVAPPRAAA
jgi:hypothetical protein